MGAPTPPGGSGPRATNAGARPRGWLRRRLLRLLAPELGRLEGLSEELDGLRHAVEAQGAGLADLRNGFLATRSEFEDVRDRTVPELDGRVTRLAESAVAPLQRELEALRDERLPRSEASAGEAHRLLAVLQGELAEVRDARVAQLEEAARGLQDAFDELVRQLEDVRDVRLTGLERDLGTLQSAAADIQVLGEEIRDRRLPALAARTDALVARLHEELTAVGGLVDRMAAGRPLSVAVAPEVEAAIPEAVRQATVEFMAAFRGSEEEISGRVAEYVPELVASGPVLDLGCGRGELLTALRDAGVPAEGVDADPAMVEACRRRGVAVTGGDVLEVLRARPAGSLGAVTAIHLLEHLPASTWMAVMEAASRALRPGGLLIAECPNPGSLRVGADLFWSDPTHRTPVHPEALSFVARAVGFASQEIRYRRPFPPEQALASPDQTPDLRRLAERLDLWLSGPRDFVLVARRG